MRKIFNALLTGATVMTLAGAAFSQTAAAGPLSMATPELVAAPTLTAQVHYRPHCARHYVRHWRYRNYAYYPQDYYSGYYPEYGMGAPVADVANVAVGLATLPFAAAFGVW